MLRRCSLLALAALAAPAFNGRLAAQVTDADLVQGPADEWLTYGRDYAETHYSP